MYYARMNICMRVVLSLLFILFSFEIYAQRDPVLKQIALPHNYYFREMYLPQLTTGPSAVAWSPDSKSLVYSMHGYLWVQSLDSKTARQLTSSAGYDYQPDWSGDGKSIVFARYQNDAVELWMIDATTGKVQQLTSNKGVNVEPRWAPDSKRIAFVSTQGTGHFHIFLATVQNGALQNVRQLTQERKSKTWRYYYSAVDHEISPAWSPDGNEILFIANREDIYGTGGFWRMKAEPGSPEREIRYEETTWKSRADWAPDGKRIVYGSYLGRQWHQIWLMTAEGGDPFPITYGEYDNVNPRWSPDGTKIAFISNRDGNTDLYVQEAVGGKQTKIEAADRLYLLPRATLNVTVVDPQGQPTPARVSLTSSDGRAFAPDDAWMHADDSFVRAERPFEPHYFHTPGTSSVAVPAGKILVEAMKGFEHKFESMEVEVKAGESRDVRVQLKRLDLPAGFENWISADMHVHMNYGGAYRNTPMYMMRQAAAENLPVVYNLVVNKEQRIPDIDYFSTEPDAVSTDRQLLVHSQEFHTSHWGHMGVLNLKEHYLIPDYVGYPNTPAASLYPTNAVIADLAHAQGAILGYVHPYDTVPDPSDTKTPLNHELPADVALGKMDYFEVVGFSDHRATSEIWYRLLNCGFKLPAGAGTDAMSNYASLRGPVGTDRAYVKLEGKLTPDAWNQALKNGRSFVTNGPLLQFTLDGKEPGDEIALDSGGALEFQVMLRSLVPIDHLQLIYNGQVVQEFQLTGDRTGGDFKGTVQPPGTGWYVLRAWNEKPTYPVLDIYPFGSTSPVYVNVKGKPMNSSKEAKYFIAWIDRVIEGAKAHPDYNSEAERQAVLKTLEEARAVYEKLL